MVAFPPRRGTSSPHRSLLRSLVATSALGLAALALTGCSSAADGPRAAGSASAPSDPSDPSAATSPAVAGTLGSTGTGTASAELNQPAVNGSVVKQARTLAITVQGQRVTPAPGRITLAQGQTLRLVITSDHADEVHAHGFEVKAALVAGSPTTLDLTGARPGVYAVETHQPALTLVQVLVR